jgi:hypothetical protein
MPAILGKFINNFTCESFTLPCWVDSEKFIAEKNRELYDLLRTSNTPVDLSCWAAALVANRIDIRWGGMPYRFPAEFLTIARETAFEDIIWDGDVLPEIIAVVDSYIPVPPGTTAAGLREIIESTDFGSEFEFLEDLSWLL